MKSAAMFKEILKDMMRTRPLEEINVTAICKKCHKHRQTFYYHYTDIYDLISEILLTENFSAFDLAKDTKSALLAMDTYIRNNFIFLKATYNSAGRDLVEDFIVGKLNAKLLALWKVDKPRGLKPESIRRAARRFSALVGNEIGFAFKDARLTGNGFMRKMTRFTNEALDIILPSIYALSQKEEVR